MAPVRELGRLESCVMDVLWTADHPLTVREVREQLAGHELAYTTVSTVLDNLHRKGLASRDLLGRMWHYRASQDRSAYAAALMHQALAGGADTQTTFLRFIDKIGAERAAMLRDLLSETPREGEGERRS